MTYKRLLSGDDFLRVRERSRQVSGINLISVDYKDFELRFQCSSVTYPDKKYTIIVQLEGLDGDKVIASGSSLAAVLKDAKMKVYCNCLRRGTLVSTARGDVPIEEVRDQDLVRGGDGAWKKVSGVLSRHVSEEVLRFRVEGCDHPIVMTKDHKVLSIIDIVPRTSTTTTPTLRPSGMLKAGNYLLSPYFIGSDGVILHHVKQNKKYFLHKILDVSRVFVDDDFYDVCLEDDPHTYVAGGVIVSNCPAFTYWGFAYKSFRYGYGVFPERRFPRIRNPRLRGYTCKHIRAVLTTYPFWSKTIAKKLGSLWTEDQRKQIDKALSDALKRLG